ncbi:hypothetical protein ACIRTB_22030 [Streptomyces sp. NPDC101158]|uniref:hypothetical protein n=1 Tax=Streptomyces sp. NPDC101158 TaxID=3366117 RepID=UPI0037FD7251
MDVFDELDDAALTDLCAAMTTDQRRHAATLALWRLRAPLLMLRLEPAWGLHRTVVERVFRTMILTPGEEESHRTYTDAVAEMVGTPLFTDQEEGELDSIIVEVQVEAIAELDMWNWLDELSAEDAERIIRRPREVSGWLDSSTQDSLWDHPAHRAHERYLATAPGQSRGTDIGYHSARNFAVEAACHDIVLALPPAVGLLGTAAGREALALCESFSAELVSTLAWQHNLGH